MDEQRAEFETAYRQEFGKRWMCPQRQDMFKLEINRYAHLSVQDMWVMWQAATQRQQERIAELEAQVQALSLDAGRYRWLREQPYSEWKRIGWGNWVEQIARDTEIDAAIAAGKGEG